MDTTHRNVQTVIEGIRSRWRRRALRQGSALTLILACMGAILLLVLYSSSGVPFSVFVSASVVSILAVLAGGYLFLVRPLQTEPSDEQIALFVEERFPDLEDRFNSAVEVSKNVPLDRSILIDRILSDASRRTQTIVPATLFDRRKERFLSYGATACVAVFLVTGYLSYDRITGVISSTRLSQLPFMPRPAVSVNPGDVELEKGESQVIIAEFRDAPDSDVFLFYKTPSGNWQKEIMPRTPVDPSFQFEFPDIQESMEYYVESGPVRSSSYTINLYEYPDVTQIDATYTYPEYTRRAPRKEENAGDLQGLKGSLVQLSIQTKGTVEKARLVLDTQQTITMRPAGNGRFTGTLRLQEPSLYHVELTDRNDKNNKFPEEYRIDPVDDEKPFITIEDPNQDVRVNAVQEVPVIVRVEDDFGVRDVRLRYSVNGQDEQRVALLQPQTNPQMETTGEHVFYLEDHRLQPGDVISYYVEAEDYLERPAPEATDMYFIEVIPFDQRYTQVNNMGNMPGGGQPSGIVLSQQEIIAATWKLHRERAEMEAETFAESHRALIQAQDNLRRSLLERINSTAFSVELRSSTEGRQVAEFLRQATGEMQKAITELTPARLQEALAPERRALNFLLKADALNKDRQVALNRQPSMGGGAGATEERMTELEDLELDISKDKYEIQQGSQGGGGQSPEVDEAMKKLKDLARRQQNLMNQKDPSSMKGEDKKRFIDRLKRDQDQLQEQAQSLARNMGRSGQGNRQETREREQRLERVAENMREAEQALREGDMSRARARQQQALNELERLQQDLRLSGGSNTKEQLTELSQEFDDLRKEEKSFEQNLEATTRETMQNGGEADRGRMQDLVERREKLERRLESLEKGAEALEEGTRDQNRELAGASRNLVQRMRRDELAQKMNDSREALERGRLDQAGRIEDDIQASLDGLQSQMRALDGQLPRSDDQKMARSLEDLRQLMDQLKQLQEGQSGSSPGAQSSRRPDRQEQAQNSGQQGQSGSGRSEGSASRRRQMDQARETLERLQRDLEGNPDAQRALQAATNYLGRADHTGVRLEGDAAKAFFDERIFSPLTRLEMDMSRQLEALTLDRKLYNARKGEVPTEYQELVDRYYEALSKP